MTSFSSLLSSIGAGTQASPQPAATSQRPSCAAQPKPKSKPDAAATGAGLKGNNAAAGVKRKAQDSEVDLSAKAAKHSPSIGGGRSTHPPPSNRFQLSAASRASHKAATQPSRATTNPSKASSPLKAAPKPPAKNQNASTASAGASPAAAQPKRGFAGLMERAKAAQEAAVASSKSGFITHKAAPKMTKRERLRMEAKAQAKAAKNGKRLPLDGKSTDLPLHRNAGAQGKAPRSDYQGTMKKAPVPLAYSGTMRASGSKAGEAKSKKGQPKDKYGGYASWSDLDDAEEEDDDDEEEDYDSEGSSDMEGGFDDMQREEQLALRAAKKEDLEAQEEEERLRREKLKRKQRLQQLSQSAAAKKKY